VSPNCGTCSHYVSMLGTPKGYCHGVPPASHPSGVCTRPQVRASDYRCGVYSPLAAGERPAEKAKVNPDTPGHAARAAREARRASGARPA